MLNSYNMHKTYPAYIKTCVHVLLYMVNLDYV